MTSTIAKFYAGRSVFVTGGTGFLGKQIVEKLLRSCPEIDNIYLLIRGKRGENVQQRLRKTLELPLFDVLREKQPSFSKKVVPITGDVLHDFLGISDADHRLLSSNVSVVMHSAAAVSFVEPFRATVNTNVLGVRRTLDVCKQLPHLESMVHISTAFSQCHKLNAITEEKVYDPPISSERVIALLSLMNDEELEAIAPRLMKVYKSPGFYTLTKAIGEKLVEQEHGVVPACIVRPSGIAASQAEPFPGWIDNYIAGNGVFVSFGIGALRCLYSEKPNETAKFNIVPVDRVANTVIVAAWQTAINRFTSVDNEVPVYNMTSENLHTVKLLTALMLKISRQHPYSKLHPARFSLPSLPSVTNNWPVYSFITNVFIPLRFRIKESMQIMTGEEPSAMKMYRKFSKYLTAVHYFASNYFDWEYKRMLQVYNQLDDVDKKEFNCLLNDMDVEQYYKDWWFGLKKYVLKDPACNQEQRQLLTPVQPANVDNN